MTQHRQPSATSTGMVSMQVVRTLATVVADAGGSQASFLRAANLEPTDLQALSLNFPRAKLHDLCALALDLTEDPALGLHSIERLATEALNPIASLVAHSATLLDALNGIQQFRQLYGDEPSFRIRKELGKVIVEHDLVADERPHVQRYMAEVTLAGLFCAIRRFEATEPICYVAFQYKPPQYVAEYQRIFGGRARFEQAFTGLGFESGLLAAPAPYPDAELHHTLWALARRRIADRTNGASCAARLHDHLVWQSPPRDMSMQAAARALGLSIRTLRRQLAAEGKLYSDVVTQARAAIAKSCLRNQQQTIEQTARELGFSDATGFHRAFKRWTGLTPHAYRKAR
jgi:AraC-like DNA-binding protein